MNAFLAIVLGLVEDDKRPVKVKIKQELTAFDGTAVRQDLRDIRVSGVSEVSGVAGDGEREQAVTEEEDMISLAKGKGGLRYGLSALSPVRQLPIRIQGVHRSGLEDGGPIPGESSDSKIFRRRSSVCRGRGRCWIFVGGNWSGKKTASGFHVHLHHSLPCTPAIMKRVADSQLTKDTEDGDGGSEVNCRCRARILPKIYLALFSQEVGIGFKKASDSELANRRCACPFPYKPIPQLIPPFFSQSKNVAETCVG